eukprot:CAMPEP_0202947416 /NCGR_PEP_ID=MMETSP1395-20130829/11577_1 /ASSEMBLY_ACC=CAM_ASM_000871 /TAXON_ID=5961 /ORGANISM="Blepharisma japonicum, Strain Stock R1072" /LENGTH=165 /DNA_ID=CAMNT_0049648653 /DNA_START=2226 /DNA_END=2726 /DNA_ORIENTATION=-
MYVNVLQDTIKEQLFVLHVGQAARPVQAQLIAKPAMTKPIPQFLPQVLAHVTTLMPHLITLKNFVFVTKGIGTAAVLVSHALLHAKNVCPRPPALFALILHIQLSVLESAFVAIQMPFLILKTKFVAVTKAIILMETLARRAEMDVLLVETQRAVQVVMMLKMLL